MLLCWGEGHGSGIHDHADSHCLMKVLQGSIEEVKYAWPSGEGEEVREIGRTKLELNDTCYINSKYLKSFESTFNYSKNLPFR